MCSVEPSRELVVRWRSGEQQAAEDLLGRYWQPLVRQLQPKIGIRFRAKFDAEDVALSAFNSFLHRTAAGQYQVDHTGGLWQLLKRIAERKLQHRIEHHSAQKRSVFCETALESAAGLDAALDPVPETTALLAAEFDDLAACFQPREQEMIRLRLEGGSLSAIAVQVKRGRGAVDSVLKRFRQRVESRLLELRVRQG